MEYLSEEDGYPEPQLVGLEMHNMWRVPALQEVAEEERGRESEEEREEEADEDLVGMAVLSQLSRYDDQFVVDEVLLNTTVPDPIRLKGIGGVTLFGMSNVFDNTYPSQLIGKVAPEEFHTTMLRVNRILRKSVPFNLKCFLCGCLCCCCTFGLSLGPVLCLSKRTKARLEKVLAQENWRLYNKLGLNITLSCEHHDSTNLREYVLLINFLPKVSLYSPD